MLHKSFMAMTIEPSETILESVKTLFSESTPENFWKKYQSTYHGTYAERIDALRVQAREKPKQGEGDLIMPSLLKKWTGGRTANQPTGNYFEKATCSFPSDRVAAYEKACKAFPSYLKMNLKNAAINITKLLVYEIAYLKSWEVEWEAPPAALAGIHLS